MTDVWPMIEATATVVGAFGTVGALAYAVNALRSTQKSTAGELIIRIDERFDSHYEVHAALRPGGKWSSADAGPVSAEDWINVETYMGLFERVNVLIDLGMMDIDRFDRLYGYRLDNIRGNAVITAAKIVDERDSWTDFIALTEKLDAHRKRKPAARS